MRKWMIAATVVSVLTLGSVVAAAPETFGGLPIVHVVVNGKALDVPGVIVEGRSMAPVRAVAESVGGTVTWNQDTFTATIVAPNTNELQTEVAQLKSENDRLKAELSALKGTSGPAAPAPGSPGTSRKNPAAVGTTLTVSVEDILDTHTAKVTLKEVVRGDAAWQMIQAANMFNEPAREGFEYIAAKVKFELLTMADDRALDLSPVYFDAISSTGREYESSMVVEPEPSIDANLYAGASHEGWIVFEVAKDDLAPVMAHGRSYDGTGGIWFSLKAK